MFHKNDRLESRSSRQRYLYGKQIEKLIIDCLRGYGLTLEEADRKADCEDKIDCYLCVNDKKLACQVKCRMGYSGDDILIDVYEPYWGVGNENTKHGRDYVGQYDVYIVLSKDGSTIRVIDGKRQKEVIEEVLQEWTAFHNQLPVFNSLKYKGVQMRYTRDKANGRPKVLMFIPPTIYEGQEVSYYKMKWPDESTSK